MFETSQSLKDKRVIISAGGNGIGAVMAKMFSAAGAKVAIFDLDDSNFENMLKKGHVAFADKADASSFDQTETFFKNAVDYIDGVDVLINNAGIAGPNALLENIIPDEWDKTITVDLNSAFYCSKLAIPYIKKNNDGGSIINIASSASFFGFPLRSPYTAAKWGLIGLTKTMAMELGNQQIRVNAICPGSVAGKRIDTVMQKEAETRGLSFEDVKASYTKQVSLKTFVEAEDIGNMALFLASPMGSKISGQVLGVDGHTETLTQF
ncbi:MAG: SDR family oxidoreductase [Emcibacteraceae bacterium]|jgi:NAD(P)-dependent dehydrogenase (short-subunit alcohol dehydrogenase family)|nr:SDR family oxidoreductase [Emcibacteraceae bacterium]